jgi:hypothetical protein
VFRIESDPLLFELKGIKTCECVVLISENIALIEAKSSSPRPDNKEDFDQWIDDIRQKFSDSLALFDEIKHKTHGEDAFSRLPEKLQEIPIDPNHYLIYLIVYENKIEWMSGIQDALREALREEVDKWNLKDSNIKAINDEIALEMKLIVEILPRE